MAMSKRTEHYKRTILKTNLLQGKENASLNPNAKSVGVKSDAERKKRLPVYIENQTKNVACGSLVQKFTVASKTPFPVYQDENKRSRSPVRRNANKRDIKIGTRNRVQETPVSTRAIGKNKTIFMVPGVRQRARSWNNNQDREEKRLEIACATYSRRTCSEGRRPSCALHVQHFPISPLPPKIRHLSKEVKKRTLNSIITWANNMRKSRIDTMPKKRSTTCSAAASACAAHTKTDANYINNVDFPPKIARHEFNLARSDGASSTEISNNLMSNIKDHIINSKCIQDNNRQFMEELNSNYATHLDTPQLLASAEVRYKQGKVTSQSATKKEKHFRDTDQMYEIDYLEEVPDTERKREDSAPKLSSGFLHENINAQQRRVIVGYLIHLGMHCNYESSVIHQTVKLFDIAVDRIPVNTEQIQLLALACLWIILKRESTSCQVPLATNILKLAKGVYNNEEKCLLIYEKKILSILKFNVVRFADPFSLLTYYVSSLKQYISRHDLIHVQFCGSYLIDLSMLDESLCVISVFVLAMTAFELSLDFMAPPDFMADQTWRQCLRNKDTLAVWEKEQVSFTKQLMIKLILRSDQSDWRVVYRKYRRSKYCGIADFLLRCAKKQQEKQRNLE